MEIDVVLDPFGASWPALRGAALVAEEAGLGGVWTWDHLAGSVHGADGVLEAWTVLSALAEAVPRVALGPLVLNVANRRPGVLAVAAATLQQISGGRLLLGLGAGGGADLPYPAEQEALGVPVPPDPVRRRQVAEAVHVLRQVWSGAPVPYEGEHQRLTGAASGFLRPDPVPPVVLGAFGPKMGALAGAVADGLNVPLGPRAGEVVAAARAARAERGEDPAGLLVAPSVPFSVRALEGARREALEAVGASRALMLVPHPYDLDGIRAVGRAAVSIGWSSR